MTVMNSEEIKKQWLNSTCALAAVFTLILIVFYDTVSTLVLTWWNKPEYNHCLLILPIIVYLIHERRELFEKIAPKPSWLGLIPVVGGGMLWLLGDLADANVVRQFGLIILLQGTILTILGKRVTLALLFPIFYMIFLIPFGDFLVPILQDYTTVFVVTTLNLLNIPVYVEGVFLSIPAGDFHVAEACAGLRFLVATVALGTLMANVAYKTAGRQIIVVILSIIVPILANGVRASGIILIAHWSDMKYATGVDHLIFGWIFFAIVLLTFIGIAMTFTNRKLSDGYIDFSKDYWTGNKKIPVKKMLPYLLGALIFTGLGPLYVSLIEQRYQSNEEHVITVSEKDWGVEVTDDRGWRPSYAGADQVFYLKREVEASGPVDIFIGYYKYQSKDKEMIRYGNGVAEHDMWERAERRKIPLEIAGQKVTVIEEILQSRYGRRVVWYWYWVDGKIVSSTYEAKLYDAKAKLLGGRLDSAIVALSVPVDNDTFDDRRKILSKVATSLPLLSSMVNGAK